MKTKEKQKAIADALAAIAERNDGTLTPEDVLTEAADANSILHDQFTWDADKAAHSWRLEQARTLIRSVKIVVKLETTQIRTVAYVRDPDAEPDEQGYVSTVSLAGDRARSAVIAEFQRAGASMRRAKEIATALGLEKEVDVIIDLIETTSTTISARVTQQLPSAPH